MEKVIDNKTESRFELKAEGETAFADYRREGKSLKILHVETPMALRGGGVASKLMQGIMEIAKSEGAEVTPVCSYAVAWMLRHPVI